MEYTSNLNEYKEVAESYIQKAREEFSTSLDYKQALIQIMQLYATNGSEFISSSWIRNALIMFFIKGKPSVNTHYVMSTRSKRLISIRITSLSGNIYLMNYHGTPTLAIYVGQANKEEIKPHFEDEEISFFYVFGHDALSFWDYIDYAKLRNEKFPLVAELAAKRIHFSSEIFQKPEPGMLFENMEKLSDCSLVCKDGEIKTSRFLLCQKSQYFLTYFTKYSNGLNKFPLEFNKKIVLEYLRYIICSFVQFENVMDEITQCLEVGCYFQDFEFVQYIYEETFDQLEEEEQRNLNNIVNSLMNK